MALRGVWPDEKAPWELTDKADTGVLTECWKPPRDAVKRGLRPARSRAVGSRDELIMVGNRILERVSVGGSIFLCSWSDPAASLVRSTVMEV